MHLSLLCRFSLVLNQGSVPLKPSSLSSPRNFFICGKEGVKSYFVFVFLLIFHRYRKENGDKMLYMQLLGLQNDE